MSIIFKLFQLLAWLFAAEYWLYCLLIWIYWNLQATYRFTSFVICNRVVKTTVFYFRFWITSSIGECAKSHHSFRVPRRSCFVYRIYNCISHNGLRSDYGVNSKQRRVRYTTSHVRLSIVSRTYAIFFTWQHHIIKYCASPGIGKTAERLSVVSSLNAY